jgi:hypothetical protein
MALLCPHALARTAGGVLCPAPYDAAKIERRSINDLTQLSFERKRTTTVQNFSFAG